MNDNINSMYENLRQKYMIFVDICLNRLFRLLTVFTEPSLADSI